MLCYNVWGINCRGKRLNINRCLKKWSPSVVCFQETKVSDCTGEIIESLWRIKEKGWATLPAKGVGWWINYLMEGGTSQLFKNY